MRQLNKLTASQVDKARFENKPRKLADGGGLYLHIMPSGRFFRVSYRIAGKEKTYTIGEYPQVTLKRARVERDQVKALLARGIDPVAHRRLEKVESAKAQMHTLAHVGDDWITNVYKRKVAGPTFAKNERRYQVHIRPALGKRPVSELTALEILQFLRNFDATPETQSRLKVLLSQILRYAVALGLADRDVTIELRGLTQPVRPTHRPALLDPNEIGAMLRAMEGHKCTPEVWAALNLLPHIFVRNATLRALKWSDINLTDRQIEIVQSKTGEPLIIPLSSHALAIIEWIAPVTRHRSEFVFPGARSAKRPMSDAAIQAALANLGYKDRQSGHGFRAIARTLLVERLEYPVEVVEMQLGHRVADVHGRAYNRTQWLEKRREMMQTWSDYLDILKKGHPKVEANPPKTPEEAGPGRSAR